MLEGSTSNKINKHAQSFQTDPHLNKTLKNIRHTFKGPGRFVVKGKFK